MEKKEVKPRMRKRETADGEQRGKERDSRWRAESREGKREIERDSYSIKSYSERNHIFLFLRQLHCFPQLHPIKEVPFLSWTWGVDLLRTAPATAASAAAATALETRSVLPDNIFHQFLLSLFPS